MLRAANIIDGEVILPSYTFASTPHAVRWCGATPVFADIELSTFCLDADSVVRAITPKTRAILAVDLYGIVSPYARLKELAASHKLKLLVDSAPAFGAREYGKNIGVQADAHSFSFHATKAFSTMEGGAVSSTCEELVSRVALLRNFGQMTDGDCLEPGWNAKMMEVCAIIGSLQLERFEETLVVRRALAARYLAYFSHHKYFETVDVPSFQEPAWLYFPVLIRDNAGLSRDDFVRALNDENIYCRTYFHRPCHRMTVYDRGATESLVITEYVAQRVVCFPLFNDMTAGELDLILAAVDRIIEQISEIRAGE